MPPFGGFIIHDTAAGTFERVPTQAVTWNSQNGSISADGNTLVFSTDSDMLGEGRPQNIEEVWMYRRDTQQLTRLTDAWNGGHNRDALYPDISADGTRIVFHSNADLLGEGGFTGVGNWFVWLYDVPAATLRRLTPLPSCWFPSISADGRWVAFDAVGGPLSEGRPLDNEIWLCDLNDFSLRRITDAQTNGAVDRDSGGATISADGSRIAFDSNADLLSEGRPYNTEVWFYDVPSDQFTRVTDCGLSWGGGAGGAKISPDGSFIVFTSNSNLGTGPVGGGNWVDIWRYDIADARLTRLTNTYAQGNFGRHSYPGLARPISGDGRHLVFQSDADLHNDGLPDNQTEIWMFSMFPPGQDALAVR